MFRWNHDELMREGGEGLARRLGVAPVLPGTPAQRHRPDRNARWVVTAAVLTTVAVLGWRRHASSRWPDAGADGGRDCDARSCR